MTKSVPILSSRRFDGDAWSSRPPRDRTLAHARVPFAGNLSRGLFLLVALFASQLAPVPATANDLLGVARVIDGDTLEIRGVRIRLHGIDAPESRQSCIRPSGDRWRCGRQAARALSDRIGRRPVACSVRDVDRYDRAIAICSQGDEDLNRWLVGEGWAVAYRRYARDYIGAEERARRAGRNIWSGAFVMPWDWRRGRRLP